MVSGEKERRRALRQDQDREAEETEEKGFTHGRRSSGAQARRELWQVYSILQERGGGR